MLKKSLVYVVLPLVLLFSSGSERSFAQPKQKSAVSQEVTVEKLMTISGSVVLDLDRLTETGSGQNRSGQKLQFALGPNSFLSIVVSNGVLRGPLPGSIELVPQQANAALPSSLNSSLNQLVLERMQWGETFEFAVRDGKSGFTFFNVEGQQYGYCASTHTFGIMDGRLLISAEFAAQLGQAALGGMTAGKISATVTMYPVEVQTVVKGEIQSVTMPPLRGRAGAGADAPSFVPGPDVIVGDMPSMVQNSSGSANGMVGLAVATTSCNNGMEPLHWFALPNNDHPVIPQNLYRMSGGSDNTERFEQLGQSWLKHAFTALQGNACSFGCTPSGTGTLLGVGCSDPYDTGLNGSQSSLGSRAWVNPFTGFYPGSNPTPNSHSGHTHDATSHRVLVRVNDLNTSLNPGATYYAETQYITPHEYTWCRDHPGQCNMFNNASYRRFNVSGTAPPFSFSAAAATVRSQPAINAWTGATLNTFEPEPGADGIGIVAYKVSNPTAGVWHYEYAVYNQNLDRGIQSFSVPLGCGVTVSNLGFSMPPQHPAWANDGTPNSAGYSSATWATNQTSDTVTWSCETFAVNQGANAIRWGTLYNFRFDSNKPPRTTNATVGFFKTGSPITVSIQAPMPEPPCTPLQMTGVVSRKTHGAAGDFDVNLPLSGTPGIESRSSGGNHTFVFTFTNNVISGNATVTGGTGSVSGTPVFASNTMTVLLTGVTDAQRITVTASGVTDTFGQTLPDTAVTAGILLGDVNQNGAVNASDIAMTKGQLGQDVSSGNFLTDVNVNGAINAGDVSMVKSNVGAGLP